MFYFNQTELLKKYLDLLLMLFHPDYIKIHNFTKFPSR